MKACAPEYDQRFNCRDDEQHEVAAKHAEDRDRELVEEREYSVSEFLIRCVLNEELHDGGTVVDEVESAQHDADYEEYCVRKVSDESAYCGERVVDERRCLAYDRLAHVGYALFERFDHVRRKETAVVGA